MMKRLLLIAFAGIFLAGCVEPVNRPAIRDQQDIVNIADGLTQPEALTLAQKLMLEWGLDFDWYLDKYEIDDDEKTGEWVIEFKNIYKGKGSGRRDDYPAMHDPYMFPMWARVNKATGDIVIKGMIFTPTNKPGKVLAVKSIVIDEPDARQLKWAMTRDLN
jgi:hypothetical protein